MSVKLEGKSEGFMKDVKDGKILCREVMAFLSEDFVLMMQKEVNLEDLIGRL